MTVSKEVSRMSRRFAGAVLALFVAVAALSMLAAGCAPKASGSEAPTPVDPVPSASYVDLVLFFGDDQAMEVLPELRKIEVPSDPSQRKSIPALVVEELLKGPTDPLLRKTLPPEAKLLSVEVANGVAYVNFSKELQTKHWGGSAGEIMTVWSLAMSLTQAEPPDSASPISKVQILVEGKTVETLAGHLDLSRPLTRDVRTDTPFFTSEERAKELQKRVDAGADEWRKDPLQVAKIEGPARGLYPHLEYVLKSETAGKAEVEVVQGGKTYRITLIQPVTQGEGGVWVISEITS
jgi:hypothetical protein